MRLLDARTIRLKLFSENEIPAYAILSHTWEGDEVLYSDIRDSNVARQRGYLKIKYSCDQALKDGLNYVWIDACCIDKSSSAELSEAINSMFRWYREAKVCYAYLADVPPHFIPLAKDSAFPNSRWFTRGWTLQELIAPASLYFFTAQWTCIGTKQSLSDKIASITGIPTTILQGKSDCRSESVARRMSWVSSRTTTRKEDIAYCLLGIFSVNMPMLYGEGERAFTRLQEEILKESDDQSLLAWGTTLQQSLLPSGFRGALAKSPSEFATSSRIIPIIDSTFSTSSSPPTITSKGLRIKIPIYVTNDREHYGLLKCHYESDLLHVLAIPLAMVGPDEFVRGQIRTVPQNMWNHASVKKIYLKKDVPHVALGDRNRAHGFLIKKQTFHGGYRLSAVYPNDRWNPVNRTIFPWPDSYDAVRRRGYRHALLLFEKVGELDVFVIIRSQAVASQSSRPRKICEKSYLEGEHSILACFLLAPVFLFNRFWPLPLGLMDYNWNGLPSLLMNHIEELIPDSVSKSLWKILPLSWLDNNSVWCGAAYRPEGQTLKQLWEKYSHLERRKNPDLGHYKVDFRWKEEMVMGQRMFVIDTEVRPKANLFLSMEASNIGMKMSGVWLLALLWSLVTDFKTLPFAYALMLGWNFLVVLVCYLVVSDIAIFELS